MINEYNIWFISYSNVPDPFHFDPDTDPRICFNEWRIRIRLRIREKLAQSDDAPALSDDATALSDDATSFYDDATDLFDDATAL